jgi:hypothetical protein
MWRKSAIDCTLIRRGLTRQTGRTRYLQEVSDLRPANLVTADLTGNHRGARPEEDHGLFEELFIHFLHVQGFFNPARDAMTDHQTG